MVIYTQGSFDLIHSGHLSLLKRCKRLGRVVVSLLSDEAYLIYRGYQPAKPYSERKIILEATNLVDEIIVGDNTKTKEELEKIKPDMVVVGTDWVGKNIYKQYGVDREWLDKKSIVLAFLPYTENISSTIIRERIKNDRV